MFFTADEAHNQQMKRYLSVGYGAAAYLLFLAAFLYLVAFLGNFWVPRTVDHGLSAPIGQAVLVNMALLGLFGLQHSVMARPGFKARWTRLVAPPIERSTYVMLSNAVLALLYWQWRTMPAVIWEVELPFGRLALWTLFWLGWAIALASTFMISHVDLFGLRQVYLAWRAKPYTDLEFRVRFFYRLVRHPLMVGFIIAFWAVPTMTAGHLLFAIAMTGYILIATQFEERDLVAALGDQYRDYRRQVPMLLPLGHRARGGPTQPAELH
jgi:protein-S-isoprenylcysteine O-methyltransferase Ste14